MKGPTAQYSSICFYCSALGLLGLEFRGCGVSPMVDGGNLAPMRAAICTNSQHIPCMVGDFFHPELKLGDVSEC